MMYMQAPPDLISKRPIYPLHHFPKRMPFIMTQTTEHRVPLINGPDGNDGKAK